MLTLQISSRAWEASIMIQIPYNLKIIKIQSISSKMLLQIKNNLNLFQVLILVVCKVNSNSNQWEEITLCMEEIKWCKVNSRDHNNKTCRDKDLCQIHLLINNTNNKCSSNNNSKTNLASNHNSRINNNSIISRSLVEDYILLTSI